MNEKIFLAINSLAGKNELLDTLAIFTAKATPYLFIIIVIYLFFAKKLKKEALFATYSAIIGIAVSKSISLFYFHNRPFMDNLGTALIHHKADSSFPSDHTTFLFAIAISLMLSRVKYANILLILAFFGGVARVYVGVHYPFDILGGVVVGSIGAVIVKIFEEKFEKINKIILKVVK